jgi:two-component system, cell cycle sensor histidine kinase and response regulator CckA
MPPRSDPTDFSRLPNADRLVAVVESTDDAILTKDRRGTIVDWNRSAERLYGYSADEAIGRPVSMLVPPERSGEERRILQEVLSGSRVDHYDTERMRADGSRVFVSLSVSPLRDRDGEIVGACAIARDITERVRAKEALAQTEARFRTLVEAAPDPIIGVERGGTIAFASARVREVLGYEPSELVGRPIEGLVPRRLRAGHAGLRASFEAQPSNRPMGAGRELYALHKDGREIPVEISLGHTADGDRGLSTAIVVDVSGRRAAEADQALLASLVQSSGDAIISVSPQGAILSWNAAAEEMFGRAAATVIGEPVDEVVDPIDGGTARRGRLAPVFEAGEVLRYEGGQGGAGGGVLDVTVSPVRDAAGDVRAACVICRDVTHQRTTEMRSRRLAAIVDSSLDPIFAVTLDDEVISWNAAAEQLYGIAATDAVGANIDALLPDPDGDRRRLRRRVAAGETVFDHHVARRLDDGRRLELSVTSFPIRDAAAAISAVATIVRDVTERHRLEERLQQTERMEAVGRLAGGIAHDFNNLLTVIKGYGALAQLHLGDAEGADELAEVQRAATRASELTARLLDFSRQRAVDPVRLSLSATVDDLMPMLERLIGEDIRVVALTDDELPDVLADRSQLEQVVINLAVNARDAMPDGGTLTIETHPIDLREPAADLPPGRWACLTVTDTGHGIDPEIRDHLFEPFFTTKEVGQGTGLGLATVHGIVGAAGGEVRVYSEPGLGASFKVYLPAAVGPARPMREVPLAAAPSRAGHETVLLCEDEQALAALMERILTRAGYQVLAASTPDEALRLAAHHAGRIDALVTDVIMPGMNGPQLVERLRDEHGTWPTLFLSGYTADVIRDRGRLPEGSAFLEKPFDPSSLVEALGALLARDRISRG